MTPAALPATLSVGNTLIHQQNGLYSLNDLHKASGGEENHRPNQFLRNDQTRALIAELSNAQICAFETQRGKYGGTYACRELVIAYAAWISAAFHLKVIRVFLDTVAPQQPAQVALPPAQPQQLDMTMTQSLNDSGITQDMIADIVASTTQNLVQTLQQKRKLIRWQEVIEALQNPNTEMQFADLTGVAHACLARLQRNIDAEAFRVIERRAANQNVSTADVSLHA